MRVRFPRWCCAPLQDLTPRENRVYAWVRIVLITSAAAMLVTTILTLVVNWDGAITSRGVTASFVTSVSCTLAAYVAHAFFELRDLNRRFARQRRELDESHARRIAELKERFDG